MKKAILLAIAAACLAIALGGCSGASNLPPECEKAIDAINKADVGSTVEMGSYQDEALEWKILTKEKDRALLITNNVVERIAFNDSSSSNDWASSSLCAWLNEDFIKSSLSEDIQSLTLEESNPETGKVFCLSVDEAKTYLPSKSKCLATPTQHAIDQGIPVNESSKGSGWWLRSPGGSSSSAAFVDVDGNIYVDAQVYYGDYPIADLGDVKDDSRGVRPAIWISLK